MSAVEDRDWLERQREVSHRDFAGAQLVSLRAEGTWFEHCDFNGSDLRHATFDGAHFKFCRFDHANLRSSSLRGSSFAGCDFSHADMWYADLRRAHFGYVNTGADNGLTIFTGAHLDSANTTGAIFERVVGLEEPLR